MARKSSGESGGTVVYPVAGTFLNGIPAVPTIADDATAARLIATGAFSYDAPPVSDGETPEVNVYEAPDDIEALLAFYHTEEA